MYLVLTRASRVVEVSVHLLCVHRLRYDDCDDDDCHDFVHRRVEDMIVYAEKLVVVAMIALSLRKMVARLSEALGCGGLGCSAVTRSHIAHAVAVPCCDLNDVVGQADSDCLGKRLLLSFSGVWP